MKTIGTILLVIVGAFVAYIVYSLVFGGTANAAGATTTNSNVLGKTAASNAKSTPPGSGGTFVAVTPGKQSGSATFDAIRAAIAGTGRTTLGYYKRM